MRLYRERERRHARLRERKQAREERERESKSKKPLSILPGRIPTVIIRARPFVQLKRKPCKPCNRNNLVLRGGEFKLVNALERFK